MSGGDRVVGSRVSVAVGGAATLRQRSPGRREPPLQISRNTEIQKRRVKHQYLAKTQIVEQDCQTLRANISGGRQLQLENIRSSAIMRKRLAKLEGHLKSEG